MTRINADKEMQLGIRDERIVGINVAAYSHYEQ
jgi:hypothetical protein